MQAGNKLVGAVFTHVWNSFLGSLDRWIVGSLDRWIVGSGQGNVQGRALPANRTLTPPLTIRGDPMVVGSVPTKYSVSAMF
jgi:hypothetical protein